VAHQDRAAGQRSTARSPSEAIMLRSVINASAGQITIIMNFLDYHRHCFDKYLYVLYFRPIWYGMKPVH
jgi:hypothetical protein